MVRTPATKTKPPVIAHKPGRAAPAVTKTAAKAAVAEPVAVVKKAKAAVAVRPVASNSQASMPVPAPAPAPKLSKGELRAEVEKLEAANAKLRAKSRDTNKAAKLATKRIAELEAQVTRLESEAEAGRAAAVASAEPKTAAPSRKTRRPGTTGSGDAVPLGEAVIEAAPIDKEAESARDNLEHNLHGE